MLLEYSPAQITSLIWNAMATAEKHAEEGPAYKRTGNWAMGVVLNRAKKALRALGFASELPLKDG